MTDNTENKNNARKKPMIIIAIVLAISALLVAFGLANSANNQTPEEPAQPTEQQYVQANYEILEGYLDEDTSHLNEDEVFVTNYEDFQKYIESHQGIVMLDESHKVVTALDCSDLLEKFNQDFFDFHNLAIKSYIVLAGHSEYCVQTVLQNEDHAIIEVNNYFYTQNGDVDAMPAPELKFVFITLDKEITSVEYDVNEVKNPVRVIEKFAGQD